MPNKRWSKQEWIPSYQCLDSHFTMVFLWFFSANAELEFRVLFQHIQLHINIIISLLLDCFIIISVFNFIWLFQLDCCLYVHVFYVVPTIVHLPRVFVYFIMSFNINIILKITRNISFCICVMLFSVLANTFSLYGWKRWTFYPVKCLVSNYWTIQCLVFIYFIQLGLHQCFRWVVIKAVPI